MVKESCHVVVIGAGAAGLTAAFEAARRGAKVTCMSKTLPGTATCTLYSGGGFTFGAGGMSVREHLEMTAKTGRDLNIRELLTVFVKDATEIPEFLREVSCGFIIRKGGLSVKKDPRFGLLGGKPLIDSLRRGCESQGVRFLPRAFAVRLLLGETGVEGVEYVDMRNRAVQELRTSASWTRHGW